MKCVFIDHNNLVVPDSPGTLPGTRGRGVPRCPRCPRSLLRSGDRDTGDTSLGPDTSRYRLTKAGQTRCQTDLFRSAVIAASCLEPGQ